MFLGQTDYIVEIFISTIDMGRCDLSRIYCHLFTLVIIDVPLFDMKCCFGPHGKSMIILHYETLRNT